MHAHFTTIGRGLRQLLGALAFVVVLAGCTGSDGGDASGSTTSTSTSVPVTAEPAPDVVEAPNVPVGVVVASSVDGTVELVWDESRDESVTGYEVRRASPGGRTEVFTTDTAAFTDDGLEDGEIFTYQVSAVGPGGTSAGSEPVSARVGVDTNAPRRPGAPSAVETEAGILLEWRPSTDFSGIDSYIVTRTVEGEAAEVEVGEPTFQDNVAPGQIVSYSVRAVDGAGNESESTRTVTVLSGTPSDRVVVVVSKDASPQAPTGTARLRDELLAAGYTVTWFEDDAFDSNVTASDDIVLLVGDVEAQGFDWNLFGTDAHIIGLKSVFVEAGGITAEPPKLDGLAQLDYAPPGKDPREVSMTTTPKPKNVVYIPSIEQLPDLEVWATTTWSADNAVAGLIPTGGELATEKPAPGCRAFFPGNKESLLEQTNDAWDLLVEFIDDVAAVCR